MSNFSVNLASIEKEFPPGMAVPPLLKDFGRWVARMPHGSLGYFEVMAGGKFSDGALPFEVNDQIAKTTGIFMTFGEGSDLALWNHGDGPPAVVLMDSEGENRTIAPTFESFLEAWGRRRTGTELDGEYLDAGAPPQRHAEIAAWLRKKKVKIAKRRAPDFGKWIERLARSPRPPKPGRLAPPPADMAPRAIAALGKSAKDPTVMALLAELGIDLKKYRTPDSQRHLLVPPHGYSLEFEKGKLIGVEFAVKGYKSWDYANGKEAKFSGFPHEIAKGVLMSDSLSVMKKKLGKPNRNSDETAYYFDLPGRVQLLVSCVDPDDTPRRAGAVEYVFVRRK